MTKIANQIICTKKPVIISPEECLLKDIAIGKENIYRKGRILIIPLIAIGKKVIGKSSPPKRARTAKKILKSMSTSTK